MAGKYDKKYSVSRWNPPSAKMVRFQRNEGMGTFLIALGFGLMLLVGFLAVHPEFVQQAAKLFGGH
jgi:hypothetical protein